MGGFIRTTMVAVAKLIVVAAALSAVAFSAPHSYQAEDVTLVQAKAYEGAVNNLKKQFAELQVSLKSTTYAKVTPGVKDTIDKMTALIESDIEPAINDAHRADQSLLDTEMEKIQNYRDAVFAQQEILYAKAAEADQCIQKTKDSVHGYVNPYFVNGRNHYLELVRNCDFLGNLTVAKHQVFQAADEDCGDYEERTRSKA